MSEEQIPVSPLPPWGAVVLSSWVPGWGLVVSGRVLAGVLWLATLLVGLGVLLWTVISVEFPGFRATVGVGGGLVVVWVLMLVHAYRSCPRPAPPGTTWPWIAAWLSWVIPGLGQLCRRQWWRGVGLLSLAVAASFLPAMWVVLTRPVVAAFSTWLAFGPQPRRVALLVVLVARVVGGLVLMFGIRALVVHPFCVPTGAMAPTVQPGDNLFADRLTYRFRAP
jgi:hypothetical protein